MTESIQQGLPIQIGKLKLHLRPLNDDSIEELDRWVRRQHIQNIFGMDLGPEERARAEEIAVRQTLTMTFMSGIGVQIISTPDGLAELVFQMAKKDHPNLDKEELKKEMFQPNNVRAVMAKFDELNVKPLEKFKSKKKTKGNTRPKTTTKKRKKSTKR